MATKKETNGNGPVTKEQDVFIAATATDGLRVNIKLGWMDSFKMPKVVEAIEDFIEEWSKSESNALKWEFGLASVNIYDSFVSVSFKLPKDNVWTEGVVVSES